VEELRYQPSRLAQSFRINRSKIIGLIITDILNPFYTSLVRSIEDIAANHGYAIFLCNSDEDEQKEEIYIDFMIEERVAGVLLTPVLEANNSVDQLRDAGIPVICLDRSIDNPIIDTVLVDNISGAFQVVDHLIGLGHRKIAIVVGENCTTGRQREEGYKRALNIHGIPLNAAYIQRGFPREIAGKRMTKELLGLADPPTAIFCGNNLLTIGALAEVNAQGMKVPDDISIVGFDDLEWYSLVEPTITAVSQPVQGIGQKAIDLLFQRIAGDRSAAKTYILEPNLHIRGSSGRVKVVRK